MFCAMWHDSMQGIVLHVSKIDLQHTTRKEKKSWADTPVRSSHPIRRNCFQARLPAALNAFAFIRRCFLFYLLSCASYPKVEVLSYFPGQHETAPPPPFLLPSTSDCQPVSLQRGAVMLTTLQRLSWTADCRSGGKQIPHVLWICKVLIHVDGVRRCLWTAATNGPIVDPPGYILAWRVMVESYWQGKPQELRGKPAAVPHCPLHIPHGLTQARTRASTIKGWGLTAWATARP
jgi:hypothetical protein